MESHVTLQKDLLTVTGTDVDTNESVDDVTVIVDSALFVVS